MNVIIITVVNIIENTLHTMVNTTPHILHTNS